jgi:hypothetical protein
MQYYLPNSDHYCSTQLEATDRTIARIGCQLMRTLTHLIHLSPYSEFVNQFIDQCCHHLMPVDVSVRPWPSYCRTTCKLASSHSNHCLSDRLQTISCLSVNSHLLVSECKGSSTVVCYNCKSTNTFYYIWLIIDEYSVVAIHRNSFAFRAVYSNTCIVDSVFPMRADQLQSPTA